jgi:two-component system, LytTR family, response regulator
MRILIADDEAPARARLRQLLASYPDVEIIGEAETGAQAMELTERLKPDLLLLDIRMPGCSGLDIAASLPSPRPQIIFCTAYDEHAVDAFELAATDYLLKPISRARLEQALRRAHSGGGTTGTKAGEPPLRTNRPIRFLVKNARSYSVVSESRVLLFSSEDGLTRLVSDAGQFWMEPTLNDLEQRLDPSVFSGFPEVR